MRFFLCGQTGSVNRGCEAIVRSTVKLLNQHNDVFLVTFAPNQDDKMSRELGINLIKYGKYPTPIHRLFYGLIRRIFKKSTAGMRIIEKPIFSNVKQNDLCLNIGGDTYCYGRPVFSIALNNFTFKNNIDNILWCCSIEKNAITKEIKSDLMRYKYIFVREILTYENLIEYGIPLSKLVKVCDPAFFLESTGVELPVGFIEGNTVGINLSPIVIRKDKPVVYAGIIKTVEYILNKTDMSICLIPHVYNMETGIGDYFCLKGISEKFHNDRITIIDKEYNCEQLKYIISKCRFFIGARTHATIAAYSNGIPTMVLGYSIKSKGIATDLFGKSEDYVLHFEEISNENQIKDSFINLQKKEDAIIKHLKNYLPLYKKQLTDAIDKYILKK